MKYTITVKLKNGTTKTELSSKEMKEVSKILNKHPQAREIFINGKRVWKA